MILLLPATVTATTLLLFVLLLLAAAAVTTTGCCSTTAVVFAVRHKGNTLQEHFIIQAATVTSRSLRYESRCRAETDVMVAPSSPQPSAVSLSEPVTTTPTRKSKKYAQPAAL